ncbi:unnamed protein product [Symbiodinium necroappetens]|uniref:Uncharacterized protein n=1 Tax=Symbiodinium necroappetens TaxID=1628268 RepID=A0A812XY10_9DINO|nr:unnamed protein product [Symbiodinium necroappetens]
MADAPPCAAPSSLANRFARLSDSTLNYTMAEVEAMSLQEHGQLTVTFGTKVRGRRFEEVLETDPAWAKWCLDHLSESTKHAHKVFLRYVERVVEQAEAIETELIVPPFGHSPKNDRGPKAGPKSRAAPRPKAAAAAEDDRWDMISESSAVLQVEVNTLTERMSHMESMMQQIVQHLSAVTSPPDASSEKSLAPVLEPSPNHPKEITLAQAAGKLTIPDRKHLEDLGFPISEVIKTQECSQRDQVRRRLDVPLQQPVHEITDLPVTPILVPPQHNVIAAISQALPQYQVLQVFAALGGKSLHHPLGALPSPVAPWRITFCSRLDSQGNMMYQCLGTDHRTTMPSERRRQRIAPTSFMLTVFAQKISSDSTETSNAESTSVQSNRTTAPDLEGWGPPPVPLHGPAFRSLTREDKQQGSNQLWWTLRWTFSAMYAWNRPSHGIKGQASFPSPEI